MELNQQAAAEIAGSYFGTTKPLERLGWGIGGFVYLSPDNRSAVKVHRGDEGFARELEVYRRLRRLGMAQLHGLNIPKLRDHRADLRLIQMDFVSAPFLLDFAGVQFHAPDFPSDVMADWHARLEEFYGPNAWVAYAVYESLARHGIYYMDFRPSNLKLDGLPGLEPFEAPTEDEP
jgi:tRNA splicing endonuclease